MEWISVFDGYEVSSNGEVTFSYIIKSKNEALTFTEKLTFPNADFSKVPQELLKNILNNLLLILGISYWKLYCPKKIEIKDNFLTKEQAKFWDIVYTRGLGEFFYKNKIDYRGLVEFPFSTSHPEFISGSHGIPKQVRNDSEHKERSLLMLGGGKDSIVSAELLKKNKKEFTPFVISPHAIHKEIANLIGVGPLIVKREIDPKLLELNKEKGVFNGHVPISAIYAFIALLAAAVYDYRYIISSNEKSANYGNVEYLGEEINHQWSKSLEFEELFQECINKYLTSNIYCFSLLRSLHEIKIAQLFVKYPKYFSIFSSCNRNFTIKESSNKKWCGKCPKCAFVFATLAAFLSKDKVIKIFSKNLFADKSLIASYQELSGIKNVKPFECVGTPDEVKLAFYLAHKKGEFHNDVIVQMFEKEVLPKTSNVTQLEQQLLSVSEAHRIPDAFKPIVDSSLL